MRKKHFIKGSPLNERKTNIIKVFIESPQRFNKSKMRTEIRGIWKDLNLNSFEEKEISEVLK
jgi:hypothetical protein